MARKPRARIVPVEEAMLLVALRQGAGRMAACERAGVSWDVFKRRMRDDPSLKASVEDAEGARNDYLMETMHTIATLAPDSSVRIKAITNYLARYDRLRASAMERRERAAMRKIQERAVEKADQGLIPLIMGILRDVVPADRHQLVLERLEKAAAGGEVSG